MEEKVENGMVMYTQWDYTQPTEFGKSIFWGSQEDWNQTLMTKFNQMSATLSKDSRNTGIEVERIFQVPIKFKSLIESLAYFNAETGKLVDRYSVVFQDNDSDLICLENIQLRILNYVPPV